MTPEEQGRYCKACAKRSGPLPWPIGDFPTTQNTKGTLCARVTPTVKDPLLNLEASKKTGTAYANIAAGLLAVTTLTMGQQRKPTLPALKTEWVATTDSL